MDETIGHSKLHSDTGPHLLSRYITQSHHAGIRFFSPESYPKKVKLKRIKLGILLETMNRRANSKTVNQYTSTLESKLILSTSNQLAQLFN